MTQAVSRYGCSGEVQVLEVVERRQMFERGVRDLCAIEFQPIEERERKDPV